jgi:hypothetical protein
VTVMRYGERATGGGVAGESQSIGKRDEGEQGAEGQAEAKALRG